MKTRIGCIFSRFSVRFPAPVQHRPSQQLGEIHSSKHKCDVQSRADNILSSVLTILDSMNKIGMNFLGHCLQDLASNVQACVYLPSKLLALTERRVKLTEENTHFPKIKSFRLSGGVMGKELGCTLLMET